MLALPQVILENMELHLGLDLLSSLLNEIPVYFLLLNVDAVTPAVCAIDLIFHQIHVLVERFYLNSKSLEVKILFS